jgi:hypothetical protein
VTEAATPIDVSAKGLKRAWTAAWVLDQQGQQRHMTWSSGFSGSPFINEKGPEPIAGRSDMDFILVDDEEDKLVRLDSGPWVAVCESEARLAEERKPVEKLLGVGQWVDKRMPRGKEKLE